MYLSKNDFGFHSETGFGFGFVVYADQLENPCFSIITNQPYVQHVRQVSNVVNVPTYYM